MVKVQINANLKQNFKEPDLWFAQWQHISKCSPYKQSKRHFSHEVAHLLCWNCKNNWQVSVCIIFSYRNFHPFICFYAFKCDQCLLVYLSSAIIWATSWENLFYAICEQQRWRSACASAVWSAPLLFIIPILAKSKISRLWLVSEAEQGGLSLTWLQTPKTGFFVLWLIYVVFIPVARFKTNFFAF